MSRLFVSGTGTGVGKTLVTCILVAQLREAGRDVRALKPVISGFDPSDVADSDTGAGDGHTRIDWNHSVSHGSGRSPDPPQRDDETRILLRRWYL